MFMAKIKLSMAQCAKPAKTASEVVWTDINNTYRAPVVGLTICMGFIGLCLFIKLMASITTGGSGTNSSGAHFEFDKMGWLRGVLRMGPVMLILNTIVVVVPELARPAGLLSVIYQAYAFYGIFKFASEEFGGENLLARYDDSKHANEGTWQTAKPSKFWAQAPFCCVWSTLPPFAVLPV